MANRFSLPSFYLLLLLLLVGQQVNAYAVSDQAAAEQAAPEQAAAEQAGNEPGSLAPAKSGCVNATEADQEDEQRSFFLPFLTLLGGTCNTTSGMQGSCLKSSDCTSASGTSSGSCANGLGVCCMISKSCGTSASYNGTLFASSGTVSSGTCTFTISKSSSVCQIRLDFKTFTLSQPQGADQTCSQDQFIVSGASNPVPAICGDNSGQHMYLDSKPSSSSWTLTVTTSGTATVTRQWSIAVYQIPCGASYLAPDQCLQYYTGASGTIQSFNFAFVKAPPIGPPPATGGRQLANQDYTMCIRTEDGFCSITYSVCTDPLNTSPVSSAFTLSLSFSQSTPATAGDVYNVFDNGANGDNCIYDWLEIPRGQASSSPASSNTVTYDRFCGTALGFNVNGSVLAPQASVPVTSFRRPFQLYYRTNAVEGTQTDPFNALYPDFYNHGFCLNYVQNPCSA